MDGEFIETPCQAFKVIPPMIVVAEGMPATPRMASLKDARAVVEDGGCTIWGQLPDIPYKYDKFGLGFTSKEQKEFRHARAREPPLRISDNEVNALEDTNSNGDLEDWIFPTSDGGLNNWRAKDFISILFNQ